MAESIDWRKLTRKAIAGIEHEIKTLTTARDKLLKMLGESATEVVEKSKRIYIKKASKADKPVKDTSKGLVGWKVTNLETKEVKVVERAGTELLSAVDACDKAGWGILDCRTEALHSYEALQEAKKGVITTK